MILTQTKERDRFLRFMVVGVVGAVVDFGIFNLLTSLFQVAAVASSVISFSCAVVSNFIWNRYWTYPDSRSKPIKNQLSQFLVVSLFGMGIRTLLFAFLENHLIGFFEHLNLGISVVTPTFLGHNLGLAIAIGVVMLWNFFANRYWTYSDIQ